jgi:hypothetical protein
MFAMYCEEHVITSILENVAVRGSISDQKL